MNATLPRQKPLRLLLVVGLVSVSAAGQAQPVTSTRAATPAPAMSVSAKEQASRDAVRQQILQNELSSELTALQQASVRYEDRKRAGDQTGVAEAAQAHRQHTANIEALRRELNQTTPHPAFYPVAARGVAATNGPATRAPMRAAALAAQASAPVAVIAPAPTSAVAEPEPYRSWDMYQRKARPAVSKPVDPPELAVPAQVSVPAPVVRVWDMYNKLTAAPVTGDKPRLVQTEPVDVGMRDPAAQPFIVYRDPNAVVPAHLPKTNGVREK